MEATNFSVGEKVKVDVHQHSIDLGRTTREKIDNLPDGLKWDGLKTGEVDSIQINVVYVDFGYDEWEGKDMIYPFHVKYLKKISDDTATSH